MQRHKRQSGWGNDDAAWLTSFLVLVGSFGMVYQYQFLNLPAPLSGEEAGISGFSEVEAMKHIKALTDLGPHPVGSDAFDVALEYVLETAKKIKETSPEDVVVDVEFFKPKIGANLGTSGRHAGSSLVYSGLKHVILRIHPKKSLEAGADNAVLVSAHIDTVFSAEGAGDDSSSVAVMLELARAISHSSHGIKNHVVFFFNTGEEDGLCGSHSFVTQHPWKDTIRIAINLEAQGLGGKSGIFQAGPDPFALQAFSSSAKYPFGNVLLQDIFSSGVINSATDFQIYKEAGLSGLDFAFTDETQVYHTKNDKLELLKPGSIQHLGENMLSFLLQTASSSVLSKEKAMEDNADYDPPIYYDILGTYMVVYHQSFAKILHEVVIMLFLGILAAPIVSGGYPAAVRLGLSTLGTVLMVLFSILFSVPVAFILPQVCSSPVPYIASPWLVIGLFAAPALLGAFAGQHLGCNIIKLYLLSVYSPKNFSFDVHDDEIKLEAERLLFKGGSVLWLVLLILGTYYEVGSAYIALFWLVPPAFTYYLREATPTPDRLHLPFKFVTLLVGLAVPVLVTAGLFIRLPITIIGGMIRFDSDPGSNPEWLGSVVVAVLISVLVCLSLVYLLSYVHFTGAKWVVILGTIALFGLSIFLVSTGTVPPFTDDTARAVNVVHVVETTESNGGTQNSTSYLNLFATTPGKLTKEVDLIDEGFECGTDKVVDFVTFKVQYGCWAYRGTNGVWDESGIPTLRVDSHTAEYGTQAELTSISIDTKDSVRWALSINFKEVKDFVLKANSEEVVPLGEKGIVNGWHTVRFTGVKGAPTKFELLLFWVKESVRSACLVDDQRPLLKLRTDLERTTPEVERVLTKFPAWCSLYGKSTNPRTLAFLYSLPVSYLATWNNTAHASS